MNGYPVTEKVPSRPVLVDYTNYAGQRRMRKILPIDLVFGSNKWHPSPQWLLIAMDMEKQEERTFAMENIHSWSAAE